jgi:ferrous iron transport protein A
MSASKSTLPNVKHPEDSHHTSLLIRPNLRDGLPKRIKGEILMSESTQLHLLRPGQRATIVGINGESALRRRFAEMGIIRGETILIERNAPLGDPVEYLIKGYHLALRKEEAAQIEVALLGGIHG